MNGVAAVRVVALQLPEPSAQLGQLVGGAHVPCRHGQLPGLLHRRVCRPLGHRVVQRLLHRVHRLARHTNAAHEHVCQRVQLDVAGVGGGRTPEGLVRILGALQVACLCGREQRGGDHDALQSGGGLTTRQVSCLVPVEPFLQLRYPSCHPGDLQRRQDHL